MGSAIRSTTRSGVQVEERIDGTMGLTHKGQPLTYQAIAARPRANSCHPKVTVSPCTLPPTTGSSLAQTTAAGTRNACVGSPVNRTCLLWWEADISKLW